MDENNSFDQNAQTSNAGAAPQPQPITTAPDSGTAPSPQPTAAPISSAPSTAPGMTAKKDDKKAIIIVVLVIALIVLAPVIFALVTFFINATKDTGTPTTEQEFLEKVEEYHLSTEEDSQHPIKCSSYKFGEKTYTLYGETAADCAHVGNLGA